MTAATDYLDTHHIPYRLFRHEGKVESLEQAAAERGQQPGQVVRTIVFRLAEGEFALALMAGPNQVSWPALRRTLGQNRLTMAAPEEVKAATGFVPGTVSPFGLPAPLRILVDRSVLVYEEVSLGSGVRGLAIVIASPRCCLPCRPRSARTSSNWVTGARSSFGCFHAAGVKTPNFKISNP